MFIYLLNFRSWIKKPQNPQNHRVEATAAIGEAFPGWPKIMQTFPEMGLWRELRQASEDINVAVYIDMCRKDDQSW